MKCSYCGEKEAEGGVFCGECEETRRRHLTVEQYLEALKKVREIIASGTDVGLDDSNITGYKHTHAAWGMCTDSAEVWNKPEMHIWPMEFKEHGRVAPLDLPSKCPLDGRHKGGRFGCFYQCWAFMPPRIGKRTKERFVLTRIGALERYDFEIRRLRIKLARAADVPYCCECGCESSYDNPLSRGKNNVSDELLPICGDCHSKYVTVVVHDLTVEGKLSSKDLSIQSVPRDASIFKEEPNA